MLQNKGTLTLNYAKVSIGVDLLQKRRTDTKQREMLFLLTYVLRARHESALANSTQPVHLQCGTLSNPPGYNKYGVRAYIKSIE